MRRQRCSLQQIVRHYGTVLLLALWVVSGSKESTATEDYYDQAPAGHQEREDQDWEGWALLRLGRTYRTRGQYDKAITSYEQALKISRQRGNRTEEGQTFHNLGRVYHAMGQYDRAIASYQQALALLDQAENQARTLTSLGRTHYALGQYEAAILYYERARALQATLGDHAQAGTGWTLHNLGEAYQALSQYQEALGYYEQALEIRRKVGKRAREGTTLYDLGETHHALSQYEPALDFYHQALTLHQQRGDQTEVGRTLNGLAGVYRALGQYEPALDFYHQALALHQQRGDQTEVGRTLNGLAGVYRALGQYEPALDFYHQALALHQQGGDQTEVGRTLSGLAGVYRTLHQYEQALDFYHRALVMRRQAGDRAGEGWTLNGLGEVYRAQGQYPEATTHYEQALAILQAVGHRAGEGRVLHNLMLVWQQRQAPGLALFYGKQAINVYQQMRGSLRTLEEDLQRSFLASKEKTYRHLAELLMTAGRLPEAQHVLGLLKVAEYIDFIGYEAHATDSLQEQLPFTQDEATWQKRYEAITEWRTLLERERRPLLTKLSRTPAEEERLQALEAHRTVAMDTFQHFFTAMEPPSSPSTQAQEKLYDLRHARALMADLKELGPGTVALYTLVTDQAYGVILITPDAPPMAHVAEVAAADLTRKIDAFREVLRENIYDPRPLAQELYTLLVAPVAPALEAAQARTLMWSLDGVLRYLPLAALHDGERYMVERYGTVLFTPASLARLKDNPQPQWKALGLGVSQKHEPFIALPEVANELRGIIRESDPLDHEGVLPGTIKLNATFTAQAMQAALRQRYSVVHIASHFSFYPGDATKSFLLLGDGTRLPLSQLDDETWLNAFAGVDLLTLSACNTAMGGVGASGREIDGLGMIAEQLGAKAVVATLWPVADKSTQKMMQMFYTRLVIHQKSKVEALRQAQLALLRGEHNPHSGGQMVAQMREQAQSPASKVHGSTVSALPPFAPDPQVPYAHPFYWAPFILIGNWK